MEWIIRLCGWSAILFVLAIFFFVLREAAPMLFGKLNLVEFFTSPEWRPTSEPEPQFGTLALLVGTLAVTGLALLLAAPLGLGAAVYISEFCGGKLKETLKVLIELLAAIPSVVWGFVGYMVMGPIIIRLTGAPVGVNLLNGGVVLALMSVPIIVSVGEDALRPCPTRTAKPPCRWAPAVGKSSTACSFPRRRTGCWPRCCWALGRAIGETMAVLMCTGHAIQIPHSLLDPIRTLTATIAAELGETVQGGPHYRVLFVIGLELLLVSFAVNLTADLIVKGVRSERND